MQPILSTLLNYKNEKVFFRYHKTYPNSKLTPNEAFTELMKYIWLCCKHALDKQNMPKSPNLNFNCVIHAEMEEIDNMWHTFLLFTRDYHAFCDEYLNGIFFHHDPLPSEGKSISKKTYEKELQRYLSYIYDNLGEETLIKWFGTA